MGAALAGLASGKFSSGQRAAWDGVLPFERNLTREDLAGGLDPAVFRLRIRGLFTLSLRHTRPPPPDNPAA